jgi:alpha-beta hydrolase superfamily lysophospholipase
MRVVQKAVGTWNEPSDGRGKRRETSGQREERRTRVNLNESARAAEVMDRPEILERLFFPRRELPEEIRPRNGTPYSVRVAEGVSIGCRFYPAGKAYPSLLYFHGNGEIAADYDYVAPLYLEQGINLFVADYRGYGMSDGSPGCRALITDSHPLFRGFVSFLQDQGYRGDLFVMGRSLGSAPAIEVAYHHQEQLGGLIVESGFAHQRNQLVRLGVSRLFVNQEEVRGFANDIKIKEVRIPTLIIHGESDEIIPVGEGRSLFALSGAAEKRSLFVAGAGHNDLLERATDRYMEAVASFVAKKSPTAPA